MYPINLPVTMEYQGFHLHVPVFYRDLLHLEDSVHKYDLVYKKADPTRRSFWRLLGKLWKTDSHSWTLLVGCSGFSESTIQHFTDLN